MSIKPVLKLGLVFSCLALVSCQGSAPDTVKDVSVKISEPAPSTNMARPSFADMVNINAPLGVIEGAYAPLPFETVINSGLSNALEDFASSSESYGVIVWHKGQIVYEKYPEPYSADLRAESASMHKSVLALLVGAAIDDGFIGDVNDNVGTYIPEWSEDARGQIQIRDLLEMSSGLKPLSAEGGMASPSIEFMMKGADARETMMNMTLSETSPGTEFYYQNVVSQILGHVLENATGTAYQDYLSERLWKPINAKNAKVWFNEEAGFPRTYTGLYATPRDWLRLGLLIKDNGKFGGDQIVSEDYVEAMTAPSRANENYGWQIWRGEIFEPLRYYNDKQAGFGVKSSEPFAVDDILYFDGFGGQRVYISRSKDLVIVRTGNVRMDWDESLLPNLVISNL